MPDYILYILPVFFLSVIISLWWYFTARIRAEKDRLLRAEQTAANSEKMRLSEQQRLSLDNSRQTEQLLALTAEVSAAKERIAALTSQLEKERADYLKMEGAFRHEFRALAAELIEQKEQQFKKMNTEAVESLLKPFKDNIIQFRERVEAIYTDENQQRGALQNEIRNLLELNRKITEETTNLTRALKGNSKTQGDWGEMILETILDSSNLVQGIHYQTQVNLKDESGANLRPDVVLHLPEGKRIIIDSKVSLTAYVNYCECEDEAVRSQALSEHVASVRRHSAELGNKQYQMLLDSPDFVIMFVANEPAFLAALQADYSIWSEAYRKKVIISSPTNLFALLKIVDDLWKRDSQNRNAMEIAAEGARMYDKFVGFVDTLETVAKNISTASASCDKAIIQLSTGSGNLIRRAEKLRRLGIKGAKQMPDKYTQAESDELTE